MAKNKEQKNKEQKTTALAVPRVKEPWEIELEEKARARRAAETLGVPRVTYKGGILQIDGKKVDGNKLRIVPIGLTYAKEHYEEEYAQGSTATPGCYAFSPSSDKGMVPHTAAPAKQSETCDSCEHNRFGTAVRGRGKRCSDKRRILFLLADDLARGAESKTPEEWSQVVAKASQYQITIPPGSLKSFGQYLSSLPDLTPHGDITEAVTELHTEPQETGAFTVECRFLDPVPPQAMPALLKRGANAHELLAQPFPVIEQDNQPKKPVKGQRR